MKLDELPQPDRVDTVAPESLEVDGDNPNEQSDEMFGLLCDNMRTKGWLGNHVVATTDGIIADGEHRWRAAQEIGLDEVPVKFYDIDESERRLWRQELNKISGNHDTKRDALEYDYLLDNGKADDVQALTNAADEDLDELLREIKLNNEQPVAYEYDPEHNVYFEDCVEGMQTRLDDNSVDCVITDPPYGVDYDASKHMGVEDGDNYESKIEGDKIEDTVALWHDFLSEVARVVKPGGHIYCFTPIKEIPRLQPSVESHLDFKNKLVWVKNNSTISPDSGDNYMWGYEDIFYATNGPGNDLDSFENNVLEFDREPSGDYDHPTQKPVPLISFLMKQSTSKEDTILDPFMGSGTTAVAAIQNDRDYVGFELDEDNYRSVIERRIGEAKRQVNANQD